LQKCETIFLDLDSWKISLIQLLSTQFKNLVSRTK